MHGRVVWNSFQPEELIQAQAEDDLEGRFLRAPLRLLRDKPVQGGLPANNPVGQFLNQPAVGGGKRMAAQLACQEVFDVLTLSLPPLQDTNGQFSGIGGVHRRKMPHRRAEVMAKVRSRSSKEGRGCMGLVRGYLPCYRFLNRIAMLRSRW